MLYGTVKVYTVPTGKQYRERIMNPLWKYEHLDDSPEKPSWKYLDYLIRSIGEETKVIWIKNPHFAYEHLSPYHDDCIFRKELSV